VAGPRMKKARHAAGFSHLADGRRQSPWMCPFSVSSLFGWLEK
jgi:hypothetical protein